MATAIEVVEKPILFSGAMVRAILDGRKTQTRRVIKPQPEDCDALEVATETDSRRLAAICACEERGDGWIFCPYGKPGGRLWVRETWLMTTGTRGGQCVIYRADYAEQSPEHHWVPSIHMPRKYSRLSVEIAEIRVERVQDISGDDPFAEGIENHHLGSTHEQNQASARVVFGNLWDSINGKRGFGWEKNPWVWAITFKRDRG